MHVTTDINIQKGIKSAQRFNVTFFNLSLSEFMKKTTFEDGLYFLNNYKTPVCLLIKNVKNNSNGFGLISFTGALSKKARENNYVPNFAGMNICDNIGIPFIAVSDPSIFISDDMVLAWYVGTSELNFQKILPVLIDHVAKICSINLLAFGGSGGGFASLFFAKKIKSIKKVFVWNPQTNIIKYYDRYWKQLAKESYGCIIKNGLEFSMLMNSEDIEYDLTTNPYPLKDVDLVYLQNKTDWHLGAHATPFIEKNFFPISDGYFIANNSRLIVGEWGDGHAVPPTETIVIIIKHLLNDNYSSILSHVNNLSLKYNSKEKIKKCNNLALNIKRLGNNIIISNIERERHQTAFYIKKADIVQRNRYKSSHDLSILDSELNEVSAITVFSKEKDSYIKYRSISKDFIIQSAGAFSVKLEISSAFLVGCINYSLISDFNSYAFYIIKDGSVIYKTGYSHEKKFTYKVIEKGTYKIVGFMRNDVTKEIVYQSSDEFYFSLASLNLIKKTYMHLLKGNIDDIKNKGYQPRPNVKPIDVFKTDFWVNSDRNVEVSIQAFRFLSPFWAALFKEYSSHYFFFILEKLFDWDEKSRIKPAKSFWYDMSVAIRAQHIALILEIHRFFPISNIDKQKIIRIAKKHYDFLSNPSFLGQGNHAIHQLIGLAYIKNALKVKDSEVDDFIQGKMRLILLKSFDENFVNIENSPFYHNYNINLICLIPKHLFPNCVSYIDDIRKNGPKNTAWLTAPDGFFYNIGDTEGRGRPLSSYLKVDSHINGRDIISKDLNKSGYQIIRTHPNIKSKFEYFVFHATSKSKIHAHVDHLSFLFGIHGKDFIVDSGKYTYERGVEREYFKGTKGHNSIGLKNTNIEVNDINYKKINLNPFVFNESLNKYNLKGYVENKYFKHNRSIEYKPGEYITITDEVGFLSEIDDYAELRFHFGPDVSVVKENNLLYLYLDSNIVATISFFSSNINKIDLIKGEINPFDGWYSNSYNKKEPINTVCVELGGKPISSIVTKILIK